MHRNLSCDHKQAISSLDFACWSKPLAGPHPVSLDFPLHQMLALPDVCRPLGRHQGYQTLPQPVMLNQVWNQQAPYLAENFPFRAANSDAFIDYCIPLHTQGYIMLSSIIALKRALSTQPLFLTSMNAFSHCADPLGRTEVLDCRGKLRWPCDGRAGPAGAQLLPKQVLLRGGCPIGPGPTPCICALKVS